MRIIFVGIHNKPGMSPLDSRTSTGKVIDSMITALCDYDSVKTNLFEKEYFPTDTKEIAEACEAWREKYKATENDLVVFLGGWVKANFSSGHIPLFRYTTVAIGHPAGMFRRGSHADYFKESISKINAAIKKQNG